MNQLQALAMNEGYRWKKKLFSEQGRAQLEKLPLAPWASRRRQDLAGDVSKKSLLVHRHVLRSGAVSHLHYQKIN
jgi:hypothetical protein